MVEKASAAIEEIELISFSQTLLDHGIDLKRGVTSTLQINTGFLCNQACKHCHLSAGPHRHELMSKETADQVIAFNNRCDFQTIDITGGAPELNPHLRHLIEGLYQKTKSIMLRSNLTALHDSKDRSLMAFLAEKKVAIVCSLPAVNESQTDSQRGMNSFEKSIRMLQLFNEYGYGKAGSGLELNLVSNPSGAFMPSPQEQAEKRFRKILDQKWRITFNRLFTFANVPLGRFKSWLIRSGNYESYIHRLENAFNPCTADGLMCRTLVSVSWDGYLYDCDFNLAEGMCLGREKRHVSQLNHPPAPGEKIAVGNHCYACTAGSGFT